MQRFASREEYERWKKSRIAGPSGSAAPAQPAVCSPEKPGDAPRGRARAVLLVLGILVAAAFLVWSGHLAVPEGGLRASTRISRPGNRTFTALIAGMTSLSLWYLVRRSNVAARLEGSEHVLRYQAVWRWFVPLTAPIPLLLLGFSLGLGRNREIVAVLMLALTVLWVLAALEVFQVEVRLGEDSIAARTLLGRRIRLAWATIRSLEWNAAMQWFVIGSEQDRIRISLYVAGLPTLAQELARRVPSLAPSPALAIMRNRVAMFEDD